MDYDLKLIKLIVIIFILIIFALSCSSYYPNRLFSPTDNENNMDTNNTPFVSYSAIPSIVTTPTTFQIITTDNLNDISILREWGITEIGYLGENYNLWFSDSRRFVLPSSEGLLAFNAYESTTAQIRPKYIVSPLDVNQDDSIYYYENGIYKIDTDGNEVFIGMDSNTCDFTSADSVKALIGSDNAITSHWSGGDIFDSYGSSTVLIWNLIEKTCQHLIKPLTGWVQSLSLSPDGRYLSYNVTTSKTNIEKDLIPESTIYSYDLTLQKKICNIQGRYSAFNSESQLVVVGTPDQNIVSIVSPQDCIPEIQFDKDIDITSIALHPDGNILAGVSDSIIAFWDIYNGKKIYELNLPVPAHFSSLLNFSPDGRFLLTSKGKTTTEEKEYVILWGIPNK